MSGQTSHYLKDDTLQPSEPQLRVANDDTHTTEYVRITNDK